MSGKKEKRERDGMGWEGKGKGLTEFSNCTQERNERKEREGVNLGGSRREKAKNGGESPELDASNEERGLYSPPTSSSSVPHHPTAS